MSILIFLAVLFVLVLVHELGHFAVAKWVGMRVDEFGIGFPPRLFGIKRGETLYSINALPIGGFVKIFGEDSLENGAEAATISSRAFTAKGKWAQSAVLLAGVTMNVLFAWILVTIAFTMGVQTTVSEAEATETAALTVTSVLPGSPAHDAGLVSGSVIKSIFAGDETLQNPSPTSFSEFVGAHKDELLTVVYTTREGEPGLVQLTSEAGLIASNPEQPAIGVALSYIDTLTRGLGESMYAALIYSLHGLRDITLGIGSLLKDAFMFNADFSQVAGPVGIVGLVGEASAFGVTALLMFTAFISLNLAVINILPFPALDGGRFLFVLIEAVKGSPIKPQVAAVCNGIGFILLILLMVVVTWNDIVRLI